MKRTTTRTPRAACQTRAASLRQARRGLTLLEVAVCSVLVGSLLVGATQLVGNVFRHWNTSAQTHTARLLADDLMAEIQACRYEEPNGTASFGREGSESSSIRSQWDDVDDYHLWSESPPARSDGTAIPGMDEWTRTCTVTLVSPASPTTVSATDRGVKKVVVTVSSANGTSSQMESLVFRDGPQERTTAVDDTRVVAVGVTLTLQSGSRLSSSVELPNGPEDR